MMPAPFDYKRASSAAEAIALVGEHGDDAKFLAGGHSLLPLMKLRLASPSLLIDIGRIAELRGIRPAAGGASANSATARFGLSAGGLIGCTTGATGADDPADAGVPGPASTRVTVAVYPVCRSNLDARCAWLAARAPR